MAGKIVWWDLRTPDVQATKYFYSQLLDWTFEEFEFGLVVKYEGQSIGMISKADGADRGPASPTGTLLYAHVDNLESAAQAVRELGGQIVAGPTEDNDGGIFIDILDPTNVRMGLWAQLPPPLD